MTRHRLRVKICGLRREDDVSLAVALGADALGFICWPGSPRYVTPDQIQQIAGRVPAFVTRVGVFVNAAPDQVAEVVARAGLDAVQLHGEERVQDYAGLGVRLIALAPLASDDDVEAAAALPPAVTPIVDASDPRQRGGTGRRADWGRAAQLARRRAIVLAGGITPDNVAEAAGRVRPWAIDVSSGVEDAPGIKSAGRLQALFAAVATL